MHKVDEKTRAARHQKQTVQTRKRWLVVAAVLAGLLLGVGAQAAIFFRDGGFTPGDVEAVRPTDVGPTTFGGSSGVAVEPTSMPAEQVRAPSFETTHDPVATWDDEPPRDAPAEPVAERPSKVAAGSLTVLVLGVDRRPSTDEGSSSRSDTLMLVKVSPESGRVELLSVPRDLLVEVSPGVEDRINTAYAYGSVEQATAVMEDLTGISIDRYAIVDFGGFEDVINAMGGITLRVEQPIRLGIEGRRVYIPAGTQELDGLEALAYARYRGTPCGDLDRIKRQQQLVAALREQALGWNTVTKLPRIGLVVNQNVDTNLGIVQAVSLGRTLVARGGKGGIRSAQLRGTPETLPNGDAVLVPNDEANERILEKFRREGPEVRRSDHAPHSDGSSSGC